VCIFALPLHLARFRSLGRTEMKQAYTLHTYLNARLDSVLKPGLDAVAHVLKLESGHVFLV
jgi:hypothetical protein